MAAVTAHTDEEILAAGLDAMLRALANGWQYAMMPGGSADVPYIIVGVGVARSH